MTLPTAPLANDLLYLFVLGPGRGETVLLRVPPDQWIIVDSYLNADRPAAEDIFERYNGSPSVLMLTHPHNDHLSGFVDLIDDLPAARLACLHPAENDPAATVPDDPYAMLSKAAKPTYDRIWNEWEQTPSKKVKIIRGESIEVGDGRLTSLHPTLPLAKSAWTSQRCNELSSAMKMVWHNVTILLGADVPNPCWADIRNDFPDLHKHNAMKVPHHGSIGAIHDSFGQGDRDRMWVITPFSGMPRLPRASSGEGMEAALTYVSRLDLTSLPYAHDRDADAPCRTTRRNIEMNSFPIRTGSATKDVDERGQRYVVGAYDRFGQLQGRWHGSGTLEVT